MLSSGPTGVGLKSELTSQTMAGPVILKIKQAFSIDYEWTTEARSPGTLTMHLYGKSGNSRENSNGTVHPGRNFRGKKVIPFEALHFSRFYRGDRSFLYHLFGLLVPGFMSRERENFTGIL